MNTKLTLGVRWTAFLFALVAYGSFQPRPAAAEPYGPPNHAPGDASVPYQPPTYAWRVQYALNRFGDVGYATLTGPTRPVAAMEFFALHLSFTCTKSTGKPFYQPKWSKRLPPGIMAIFDENHKFLGNADEPPFGIRGLGEDYWSPVPAGTTIDTDDPIRLYYPGTYYIQAIYFNGFANSDPNKLHARLDQKELFRSNQIKVVVGPALPTEPSFHWRDEYPLSVGDFKGHTILTPSSTTIESGATFSLDLCFVNTGLNQRFYNPWWTRRARAPGAIAVFNSDHTYYSDIGNFVAPGDQDFEPGELTFVPTGNYIGATVNWLSLLKRPGPPETFYIQVIYFNGYIDHVPGTAMSQLEYGELFRSNIVKVTLIDPAPPQKAASASIPVGVYVGPVPDAEQAAYVQDGPAQPIVAFASDSKTGSPSRHNFSTGAGSYSSVLWPEISYNLRPQPATPPPAWMPVASRSHK